MRIGSLFTGAGGLDMAVEAFFGAETVWRSDIKPAACALIEHYWPGTNLGDITRIDWSQVEPVDIITGGFPCTDISAAGRQAGLIRRGADKTRSGLWAEMCRAVDEVQPRFVVAENVRAITSVKADSDVEPCAWCVGDRAAPDLRALGAVLGDLADIGYDAAWTGVRAADVGAPHGRFRVFILAWPANATSDERRFIDRDGRAAAAGSGAAAGRVALLPTPKTTDDRHSSPADANRNAPGLRALHRLLPTPEASTATNGGSQHPAKRRSGGHSVNLQDVAEHLLLPTPRESDGTNGGPNQRGSSGDLMLPSAVQDWREYEPAIRRWEALTRPAPPPTETGPKGGQRLSPRFTEWMMGWPDNWTDTPGSSRTGRLSMCGDGVVPQQAYAALEWLMPHAMEAAA